VLSQVDPPLEEYAKTVLVTVALAPVNAGISKLILIFAPESEPVRSDTPVSVGASISPLIVAT
jgi:hypothetical protein